MIDSCASTLNELDEATKKYRDIDAQAEVDKPDSSRSFMDGARRQSTIERWKQQLKVQWNKVHWDFKESSMIEYRQRLLYHTATINMVISSFIWSATNHLEASSQEQKTMLQALKDQGIQLNDGIMELIEGIQKLMFVSTPDPSPASIDTNSASVRIRAFNGEEARRPVNNTQFPNAIQSIDAYQITTGAMQPRIFHRKYTTSERNAQSSFLKEGEIPSIQQLREEINFLFRPLLTIRTGNTCLDIQGRQREVVIWVNSLDGHLDLRISLPGMAEGTRELVELLIDLNRAIERSDDHIIQAFFEGGKRARLDLVFEKLQRVSRSVRCAKEIEDFEDMRMEWDKGRGHQEGGD
ncbi:Hypothetical protein PENO1_054090 [Penicillium occitanis (nom. inval.)]|nr:Hypothetical protein PENO1_054090 [Penicillium occitanis (nom. inval.)]PCH03801.1 hypothetical protein PENOC_036730 [Penicillium occitanis (nom. inval.)]